MHGDMSMSLYEGSHCQSILAVAVALNGCETQRTTVRNLVSWRLLPACALHVHLHMWLAIASNLA